MSVNLDFEWSLSEKQADIFELGTRYRVGMCGRRFGKNEVATASLIDYALRPDTYAYGADENPICWWVGPTYTQTKKYGFQKTLTKHVGRCRRAICVRISVGLTHIDRYERDDKSGTDCRLPSWPTAEHQSLVGSEFLASDEEVTSANEADHGRNSER